jgi:tetratricopeptide (TPR) repeat protein
MISRCYKCGHLILLNPHIVYPGVEKGSFEITGAKKLCESCTSKIRDDTHAKEFADISICIKEKRFDDGIKIIQSIFNKDSDSHWYNLGNLYNSKLQLSDALDCYENALLLNTHYIKAWFRKGTILYGLSKLQDVEKLKDAVQCFKNILLLDPENKHLWNNASTFFIALCSISIHNRYFQDGKDTTQTNQEVQKWVSLNLNNKYPSDLAKDLKNYLAGKVGRELLNSLIDWWFLNHKKILDALEPKIGDINLYTDENHAIERVYVIPENTKIPDNFSKRSEIQYFNEGNEFTKHGKFEEAVASFDKALDINPNIAEAWGNRGIILRKLGRNREALDSYDKAIDIYPNYVLVWYNRGVLLGMLGRYSEALASYDKAIAIYPKSPDAWNNRGDALNNLGRYTEALTSCDNAINLNPNYALVWDTRGVALSGLGRLNDAIASFDKALAIKPDYAIAKQNREIALKKLT